MLFVGTGVLGFPYFEGGRQVHSTFPADTEGLHRATAEGLVMTDDLVLRAMRLAEAAHRKRPDGPHLRKAPEGEDRPPYFIHLAEVAWMLQDAGMDEETVAAGYLHDVIEGCGYTDAQLAADIGNERVAALVALSPRGRRVRFRGRSATAFTGSGWRGRHRRKRWRFPVRTR